MLLACTLACATPPAPEPEEEPPPERLGDMLAFFYRDGEIERVEWMLREISRTQMLAEPRAVSPVQGFFSQLFSANPERVPAWADVIAALPVEDQRYLWVPVWFSDNPQARNRMSERIRGQPELAEILSPLLTRKPPALSGLRPVSSGDLDFLWGAFFASGEADYVRQISVVLAWDPDKLQAGEDLAPMVLRRAVEWSLVVNARSHERVLEICRRELVFASGSRAVSLERIVAAASAERADEGAAETE